MKNLSLRSKEDGNVLFYVLLCVVILAALSFVLTQNSGDSAAGMSANKISEDVKAQAQTIRSALLECNLVNNKGYPAQPVSGLAKDLQCEREDGTFEDIFTGTSNRFMPPIPKPFTTGWQYTVNTGTTPHTVTIELTDAMDCTGNAGLKSAIEILKTQYTTDELDTVCSGASASVKIYIVKGV